MVASRTQSPPPAGGPGAVEPMLDMLPGILLLLDGERRIVHANTRALEYFGDQSLAAVRGRRPGELVGCRHAAASGHGCGSTEFCTVCGAMDAIRGALDDRELSRECRIQRVDGLGLDLKVWARPLNVAGDRCVLVAIQDISDEKRRELLERTFFHDILNTASGISGLSDMLRQVPPDEAPELNDILWHLSEELVDEIQQHRDLLNAEKQQFEIETRPVALDAIRERIERRFARNPSYDGVHFEIDCHDREQIIDTDAGLLTRVLANMVKNAIEASPPGGRVSFRSEQLDDDIVRLMVVNCGEMPRDIQLQVFQRSFSTKGRGRGIGTYSMKLFAEQYLGAAVSFVSRDGETAFMIDHPVQARGGTGGDR